jgi:hypothetical protein
MSARRAPMCAKLGLLFVVVLPAALRGEPAKATLTVQVPLDLTRRADSVITGSVTEVRSQWEGGRIVSRATVQVHSTLKGDTASTAEVRFAGGTVDGIGMRVSSAPLIRKGDRSVLFLSRGVKDPTTFHVVGGTAGKLDVFEDDSGRSRVVVVHGQRGEAVALEDFEASVSRAAREPAER